MLPNPYMRCEHDLRPVTERLRACAAGEIPSLLAVSTDERRKALPPPCAEPVGLLPASIGPDVSTPPDAPISGCATDMDAAAGAGG
jgi:hypothetical protein